MIESRPGTILYSDINTRTVHEVSLDNAPKVDFCKSDIKTLYVDLGISGARIATILGVSLATPYRRLKTMGVALNPLYADPVTQQKRTAGMKRACSEGREKRIAKLHNPESDAKRKASFQKTFSQDETVREQDLRTITAAREVFSRNALLARQKKEQED